MPFLKYEYLLKKYLFMILSFSLSYGLLQAGLVKDLVDLGSKVPGFKLTGELYLNPKLTLRQISNVIKRCYQENGNLPPQSIPDERCLKKLLLSYADSEEGALELTLAGIFVVAAGIVNQSIQTGKKIDLNVFSNSTSIMEKEIDFRAFLKIYPATGSPLPDGVHWKILCVFFAILPDIHRDRSDPLFCDCDSSEETNSSKRTSSQRTWWDFFSDFSRALAPLVIMNPKSSPAERMMAAMSLSSER